MGTTANGETVATTGTTTLGNTTGSPAVQQTGALVAGGGAGMSSASNKTNEAECTKEGHPVDVVTGEVVDDGVDLATPGLIPAVWRRTYSSGFADETTPLGRGGWSFSFHQWIEERDGQLVLKDEDGRLLVLGAVAEGDVGFHRGERLEITRKRGGVVELRSLRTRLTRRFEPVTAGAPRSWLRAIANARLEKLELRYQGELLQTVVDTAGREIRVTHDHAGRVVLAEVWARGAAVQAVQYGYTPAGELETVTDALGNTESFAYDGLHRMIRATLRNGVSFHYEYDPDTGRCLKTWGDGGLYTVELDVDDAARQSTTSGNPEPRRYTFDAKNNIVRAESIDGSVVVERDFDDDGYTLAERNAAGEEHRYTYDARGNRTEHVDPAGAVTTYDYEDDLLVKVTWPSGRVLRYERNRFGELERIVQPSGWWDRATYDGRGRLVSIATRDGELVRAEYDDEHNRILVTNFRGGTKRYTFDALGRPLTRTDAIGRTSSATYDVLGRPVELRAADGRVTTLAWDPLHYLTRQTNAAGQTTTLDYTGLGAPWRMTLPDGGEWLFAYDRNQRLVEMKNPKKELYELRYDRAGRVAEERTFDGRVLRYGYDEGDRLARIEQPDGSFLRFAYDPCGRVIEETSPDATVTFERDDLGKLLVAEVDELAAKVTTAYTYDDLGRVIREEQGGHVVERAYDDRGFCVKRTVDGKLETGFAYTPFGEMAAVEHEGQRLIAFRDPLGRETKRLLRDGGVAIERTYGPRDELLAQRVTMPDAQSPGATVEIGARQWDYDAMGQVVRAIDTRWGTTRHEYDAVGNLIATELGNQREVFEYDAVGALTRRLDAAAAATSSPWGTRPGGVVVRGAGREYTYDAQHRRIGERAVTPPGAPLAPATTYRWDTRGCLREVERPDGSRVRFFYDHLRRRVRKEVLAPPVPDTAPSTLRVVDYVWDGPTLCAEMDRQLGPRSFVFAPGTFVPVLQAEDGEVFAVVTDYLGTPRELVDRRGRVAWSVQHDAWGAVRDTSADPASPHGGRVASPFRTQGQFHDEDVGLVYVWHRWFDPAVGRFLSPDPLNVDGGDRLFSLDGAPTVVIDPSGLADPYDIGTYGSQSGGPNNVGDGLDADELLLNGFIKAHQGSLNDGYEYGGHGSGNASRENPTIALPGRGSRGTHAAGADGSHAAVWEGERLAGLHDPDKLAGMTAKQVIDKKAPILRQALIDEGMDPKEAKKKVAELKKKAIAHAKKIFPPCVSGFGKKKKK